MKKDVTKHHAADELFLRANTKWQRRQNKAALELFLQAARLGSASAQDNVGYFYDEGIGTKKSYVRALLWYKKAWRNDRQTELASILPSYTNRTGSRASRLLGGKKAVALNDGDAALDLAKHYLNRGARRNLQKVETLLRLVGTAHATEGARREAAKLLKKI